MPDQRNQSPFSGFFAPRPYAEFERLMPLLKRVSRSFYLSIRVLPHGIRELVGAAYLLARTADTIADTTVVPADQRLRRLLEFREMILTSGMDEVVLDFTTGTALGQVTGVERDLMNQTSRALAVLCSMEEYDRLNVSWVVSRLVEGMESDLKRFPPDEADEIRSLKTVGELDRHMYQAAGCVGAFWTRITMVHTPALGNWDLRHMMALGVGFGKALQITNVLRDVPADLRTGRCYLPLEWLEYNGLSPQDLLDPGNSLISRPTLRRGIELALRHFNEAERYVLAIPRRCVRLRLAAIWPLLMGLATLEDVARRPDWLNPENPSKVSRSWVYRMIGRSTLMGLSNSALENWMEELTDRVRSAIAQPPSERAS